MQLSNFVSKLFRPVLQPLYFASIVFVPLCISYVAKTWSDPSRNDLILYFLGATLWSLMWVQGTIAHLDSLHHSRYWLILLSFLQVFLGLAVTSRWIRFGGGLFFIGVIVQIVFAFVRPPEVPNRAQPAHPHEPA